MQNFIITLLICSITMSALALLYMAATPLLAKRYSVSGRYYAWLIFVIGLIIPFRPRLGNPIVRVDLPGNTALPVLRLGNAAPVMVPSNDALPSAVPNIQWWQIVAGVWLAGMFLFLAYHLVKHYRFLKLAARWGEDIADKQTLALLENLKAQMGISRKIGLQSCGSVGSPMLIGFIHPKIILPNKDFALDELRFILKHELVHFKRKDLWYKSLVLIAAAIHWFNPLIYLIVKAIDIQCELSCDAEVVRNMGADIRLSYSETIIGVVRYKSSIATAFSTNFYGGKKGMKSRIFSIMDKGKKKTGLVILCVALMLTVGTGAAFAANAATQNPHENTKGYTEVTPWIAGAFLPNPDVYAKYADFGITISEDGSKLLYHGQPVRLFADEGSDEAFYLDEAGNVNLSVVRNAAGQVTGLESITVQKAQEYQDAFFAEELGGSFPKEQDIAKVQEGIQVGANKYEAYQPFGVTYSVEDGVLSFNGQRVRFFMDQAADEGASALWTDEAGTANLVVLRDASGQITGVESISDEKAQEYLIATQPQIDLDGLEEKLETKMRDLYPNGVK